jgi:hypothetical protein
MADDLRIATDLTRHPKTLLLIRRLSDRSFRALLALWGWVADNRPLGDLSGMTDDEIAIAAGWPEDRDAGEFVTALASIRWLDGSAGAYQVHDWAEHQPWIVERAARVEKAKRAASARWQRDRNATSNAQPVISDATSIKKHAPSNAPNPTQRDLEQAAVAAVPACEARSTTADVETVPGEEPAEAGKGRNAGRQAEPRALSADKRIVLNQETWTFDGITDADVSALAAEFPLVDVLWAAQDTAGYARVDERYRKHKNWARTWRNRCRMLQDRAERGLDAGPRPRMSSEASAPPHEAKPAKPLAPLCQTSVDWAAVVEVLEARAGPDVARWIRPLRYVGDRGELLELVAPDEFHAGWVRDNLDERFRDVLLDMTGRHLGIRVVVDGGAAC